MPEIRLLHLGLSQRALVATTTPSRSTPLRWRARRRAARAASCSATTPPSSCDSGASRRERRCATTPCVPAAVPAPPASASSPRRVLPQRRSAGAPRLSGRPLAPRQPRRRRAGGAWCKGYTCTCAPRVTRRRQPQGQTAGQRHPHRRPGGERGRRHQARRRTCSARARRPRCPRKPPPPWMARATARRLASAPTCYGDSGASRRERRCATTPCVPAAVARIR